VSNCEAADASLHHSASLDAAEKDVHRRSFSGEQSRPVNAPQYPPFYGARIAGKVGDPFAYDFTVRIHAKKTCACGFEYAFFFSAGYDLPLLNKTKGAYDGYRIFPVFEQDRHGGKLALRRHIHKKRLDNIVKVMAKGDLVKAALDRIFQQLHASLG
jgi:hypothetical protein